MKLYTSIKPLVHNINEIKSENKTIGIVPTMGFFHEGHLMLIRRARRDSDYVVVSIFVNPIQFAPGEDLKEYPRDLKRDLELCKKQDVDIVFIPDRKSMYPDRFSTYVNVEDLTEGLCGSYRPGHFKGVTTIVTKLFNIIRPDAAYFGQKDAQQAIIIKKMVSDLNMPIKVKVMPIVRERDGLAMSSRNVYLDPCQRQRDLSIYRSLRLAKELYIKGENDPKKIIQKMRRLILKQKDIKIDYISIVDIKNLKGVQSISKKVLVVLAVWVGKTRLIDNVILGG